MWRLSSEITIGGKRFRAVNGVQIKRSINELMGTATIRIPVTALLKQKGSPPTKVQTAQAIAVGDPVLIRLGYDGKLQTEFTGYVKTINLKTPVEIECEDEFYQCRRRKITLSGTTTLADVLAKCGLKVAYSETLTLKNFVQKDRSVAFVLSKLKTDYGLSVFFDLQGRIYACRPYKVVGDTVKYRLRYNVINDDSLQYQNRDDVKIEIKAVCFKKDGTKVEATKGDKDGTTKTLYFYDVENMAELAALAERELQRYSYDGYTGQIETFLAPYAAPAMAADLSDKVYPQRDGCYYIESVETTFGTGGGRRKVEIGIKI